ncbi:hypothetical protein JYB87_09025 [Shewanella avicenniae]|uniref:Cellulose synthase subunit D n=1 Tax=Shewanella avicenniae TaxID=2814294 RepID=A0ABX7QUY3_9GAMM|nr:hypothetical protein [Shewanella avicenniae]QSX35313.1 hypothetical protein JYB87_09025 [Shewanella avicenniae]
MSNASAQSLRYLEQQHCTKQWRLVVDSLANALATLEPALKQSILHRTGQQMAESFSLDVQPSLAALTKQLNEFWFQLDWGYVEISLKQERLYLEHHHCPVPYGRYDSHAYASLSMVLEGFYSTILAQQGGEDSARVIFMQSGNPMIFEYKNQENA